MKLLQKCEQDGCGKILEVISEEKKYYGLDNHPYLCRVFRCGHSDKLDLLAPKSDLAYHSLSGMKQAYDFQIEGLEFARKTNYNCLIADAMGLGKTIQSLLCLQNNKELLPCLVVVPSATVFNWVNESKEWFSNHALSCFPIIGTCPFIPPGFDVYIVSRDSLGKNLKSFLLMGFKSIIVDECHAFKEDDTKRTRALVTLVKSTGIKHKIFLSGTPIKNRADEYFTVLNLLAPEHFPFRQRFQHQWLEQDEKGKWSRLNRYRMDKFHELTNRWIIRREKHEVLKNLPSFRRDYITINIEDQLLRNSYNRELGIANTLNNSGKQLGSMEILGILAKLRRITGMAKIPWCVDYVNEFMTESDEKLALGIHHESVRDNLFYTLEQYSPLKLSGEDSAWRKNEIQNTFNNDPYRRLLIINILAGGVGMNLQGGNNFVCLERQWSSADEEQFESRFHRDGQKLPVSGLYPIAYGTIDQWFHEIVENKRDISKSTLGDSQAPWDITADPTMLKALFEKTLANPLAA